MLRLTPIVKNLLIINVGVYLLSYLLRVDLNSLFALRYVGSELFAPYQFFTYMFAHGSFTHLLFNMLALFFMGPILENYWGVKRFLTFYLVTGIGAGILYSGIVFFELNNFENKVESYVVQPTPEKFDLFVNKYAIQNYNRLYDFIDNFYNNPEDPGLIAQSKQYVRQIQQGRTQTSMVGASGAIYGLLMAIALLFPNMQFFLIFPPIPVKAKYMALVLGGIALYSGLQRNPGDMVAHFAHLGGMVFAFIMIKIWGR
ncbi:MAG: rhomboid family intramembrane serine protease [Candidatus Cyclobacteriaceae bacterium M3_2C_046]